eukprot:CAMPEP_0183387110 /NCGR_PEP_ID=MMETSP0370-20130417/2914_1 /TAXON_ID=268820 /ORGANISM="Peridinium aciculiferum, Strain PAER-2" /LENGTH=162 /DNA_ID=CAMNT_0025565597 /DNA_START=76 /DNA_END=561 /DNA_ORIENTATION=+
MTGSAPADFPDLVRTSRLVRLHQLLDVVADHILVCPVWAPDCSGAALTQGTGSTLARHNDLRPPCELAIGALDAVHDRRGDPVFVCASRATSAAAAAFVLATSAAAFVLAAAASATPLTAAAVAAPRRRAAAVARGGGSALARWGPRAFPRRRAPPAGRALP